LLPEIVWECWKFIVKMISVYKRERCCDFFWFLNNYFTTLWNECFFFSRFESFTLNKWTQLFDY
jgi:hypothetical protein